MNVKNKRELALKRQGGTCFFCGEPATPDQVTAHHVLEKSKGGSYSQENIRAAHRRCHMDYHGMRSREDKPTIETKAKLAHIGFVDVNAGLWWKDTNGAVMGWQTAVKRASMQGKWPNRNEWREIKARSRRLAWDHD